MWLLRLYLLGGLIAHKAVWESLKHKTEDSGSRFLVSTRARLMKLAKMVILTGVALQTILPTDVLPIESEPFWLRAAGTVLYTLGLLIAVTARVQLRDNWSDIESPTLKPEHKVVSHGLYRYVRHPIYIGDILLLIGLELALNSWLLLGTLLLLPVVVQRAAREERFLTQLLPGYEGYRRRSKRFIPFVV